MPRLLVALGIAALVAVAWWALDPLGAAGPPTTPDGTEVFEEAGALMDSRAPALSGAGGAQAEEGDEGGSASASHARARRALQAGPPPASVTLRGVVRGPGGEPRGGTTLEFHGASERYIHRTKEDGRFELSLPAGRYDLLARAPGFSVRHEDVLVASSTPTALDLRLEHHGEICLTLTRRGEAVSDAIFFINTAPYRLPPIPAEQISDDTGSVCFKSLPAGRYGLLGRLSAGLSLHVPPIRLDPGEAITIAVDMPEGVRLRGLVRAQGGGAIPDAAVELDVVSERHGRRYTVRGTTLADGTFQLDVPRGEPVRFQVRAKGYAPFLAAEPGADFLHTLRGLRGEEPVHAGVELVSGVTLQCLVADANEAPLSGIELELREASFPNIAYRVRSDAEGRFSIPAMAHGEYIVRVLTAGFGPRDTSKGSDRLWIADDDPIREETIFVTAAERVSGRVVEPGGEGVAGARVWIVANEPHDDDADARGWLAETFTSQDGSFALASGHGEEEVVVRASRGPDAADPVSLSEGPDNRAAPLRLVLKPTARVEGLVLDARSEEPAAGVDIVIKPATPDRGRSPHTARTDDEGRFRLHGLLPGTWRFTPQSGNEHISNEAVLVTIDRAPKTVRLEVERGLVFEGLVTGEDGQPIHGALARAHVLTDGKRTHSWDAQTDRNGRFRIEEVFGGALFDFDVVLEGYTTVTQSNLRRGQEGMHITLRKP